MIRQPDLHHLFCVLRMSVLFFYAALYKDKSSIPSEAVFMAPSTLPTWLRAE